MLEPTKVLEGKIYNFAKFEKLGEYERVIKLRKDCYYVLNKNTDKFYIGYIIQELDNEYIMRIANDIDIEEKEAEIVFNDFKKALFNELIKLIKEYDLENNNDNK